MQIENEMTCSGNDVTETIRLILKKIFELVKTKDKKLMIMLDKKCMIMMDNF